MLTISPKINNISFNTQAFRQKSKPNQPAQLGDDNPISRKGEVMNLIKTTFVGGLVMGGYLLAEVVEDGDFLIDELIEYSKKKSNAKNKKEENKIKNEFDRKIQELKNNKFLKSVGVFVALTAALISGFALLYTLFNAPKIAYNSKVNTFKKSKEMDVYIKANEAERELYTQLDEKAKNSTPEEKEQLKTQYMQMRNAKNQVPDFVQLKR